MIKGSSMRRTRLFTQRAELLAALAVGGVAACASPPDQAATETGVQSAEASPAPRVTNLPTLPANRPDSAVVARAEGFRSLHSRVRVEGLNDRRFSPETYWASVLPVIEGSNAVRSDSIGVSAEGRPLRLVRFGSGETKVLLWSQMHGDESTASMALADILSFIAERPGHPSVRAILENLEVGIVPVLNPDGAARFERRNSQGIDINRDARALQTPEGRALKSARDEMEPDFAFNLHDQGIRTRVGETGRGAAIALLAPPDDESRRVTRVRDRAFRVASVIRDAMEPM
ncbi:MAG: M14 family zinc carboxypeptidase, partial [Gemmatimonadota bacterium]|nr:M14 family zinc carboxypeptidase [Gemmatimonadota bacterium]